MRKKKSAYQKFEIKRKGSIEENIEKLKGELDVYIKGAKDIKEDDEGEEREEEIKPSIEKKSSQPLDLFSEKVSPPSFEVKRELRFNKKLLIIPVVIFLLFILLMKFSVFKYETSPKRDTDIPGIKIKSVFYYNIFGKKLKEKTFIIINGKKIKIPLSVEKWIELPKEKKLRYLKVFQQEKE